MRQKDRTKPGPHSTLGAGVSRLTSSHNRRDALPTPKRRDYAHPLGVSVYEKQLVHGHDRAQLTRLCRYVLRPPLSQERLELRVDGTPPGVPMRPGRTCARTYTQCAGYPRFTRKRSLGRSAAPLLTSDSSWCRPRSSPAKGCGAICLFSPGQASSGAAVSGARRVRCTTGAQQLSTNDENPEKMGASHCDGKVQSATLADALVWVWHGYEPSGN